MLLLCEVPFKGIAVTYLDRKKVRIINESTHKHQAVARAWNNVPKWVPEIVDVGYALERWMGREYMS